MRAGPKDRRVRLEVKTVVRDTVGQPIETWGAAGTLHAQKLEGSKVAERFGANQTFATVTTIFRVGYFPAFAAISPDTHRVVLLAGHGVADVTYNVLGAVEIGRKRGVELMCVARGEHGAN